ncbi:hypothetical protein [Legionella sp. 16cNR16C]|uniref:hypothetical protein n=1 Tax=Legionella sp. 16cNR16C TaxID=2905656 RepID=UPI001E43A0D4|nr:hypothetical protein [Legionella sp. 16cNR16C]MCE3044140.1 hypothetical protein [Legionella sp. 16cNR16C]
MLTLENLQKLTHPGEYFCRSPDTFLLNQKLLDSLSEKEKIKLAGKIIITTSRQRLFLLQFAIQSMRDKPEPSLSDFKEVILRALRLRQVFEKKDFSDLNSLYSWLNQFLSSELFLEFQQLGNALVLLKANQLKEVAGCEAGEVNNSSRAFSL